MPFPSDASAALSSSLAQTIHDVAQCSTHTPSAESSYIHTLYLAHQPCAPLHEHRQIVEGVLVSVGEAMCLNRFLRRGTSSLLHRPCPSTSALWISKSIRHLLLTSFPILQGRQGHLLEDHEGLSSVFHTCVGVQRHVVRDLSQDAIQEQQPPLLRCQNIVVDSGGGRPAAACPRLS